MLLSAVRMAVAKSSDSRRMEESWALSKPAVHALKEKAISAGHVGDNSTGVHVTEVGSNRTVCNNVDERRPRINSAVDLCVTDRALNATGVNVVCLPDLRCCKRHANRAMCGA